MDIETGKIGNDSNGYRLFHECPYTSAKASSGSDCDITQLTASSKCLEGTFSDDTGGIVNEALLHCPICFESSTSINQVIRSNKCGHAWCQDCLFDYCEFQISNHRVPIPCPSSASTSRHEGCKEHLPPDLVRRILSQFDQQHAFLAKLDRLERLANDPSLVACPRCNEIVVTPETPDPTDANVRICPNCEHIFCSLHLDAHLGKLCQDHVVGNILRLPNTKPCSHCGAALQKYAGCDHVVCPACHDDMCFRCGTHLHLTGKVTRYCIHCQQGYLDHRYLWQIRLYYCLMLPFALPFVLIYSVAMIGVVLLTFCCCGCFGCGAWLYKGKGKADPPRAFLYVTFIISLPFILMLYDVGYRFNVVDDFLEWSLVESPASSYPDESGRAEREVSDVLTTLTSSNISEE